MSDAKHSVCALIAVVSLLSLMIGMLMMPLAFPVAVTAQTTSTASSGGDVDLDGILSTTDARMIVEDIVGVQ